MNQIFSRFSLCRSSSPLRKNPFTRWASSSKPISSSSSNLIKVLHHHAIDYPSPPPQISGNYHVSKFSGEESECDFRDDDDLENEIWEIQDENRHVRGGIQSGVGPSLEAAQDLADKFNAFMEKWGLETLHDNKRDDKDFPHHLQKFKDEIEYLEKSVDKAVAYGEFIAAGGDDRWDHFESNCKCMLKYHEILASLQKTKIKSTLMRRLISQPSPPKIPGDRKFNAVAGDDNYLNNEICEVQADDETDEDVDDDDDMMVAYEEYVAAGGDSWWQPFMGNYRCMIKHEEILASLGHMKIRSRLMRRLVKAESDFQSTGV